MAFIEYHFVSLRDQERVTAFEMHRAQEACRFVRRLLDQREQYITENGLDAEVWMPAANWHTGQRFYENARDLLNGNRDAIELLRIYGQQFSGYALWSMSRGKGTSLPPRDRSIIEERLRMVQPDEQSTSIWERLRAQLPEYLRISPPAKFGECGWRIDGTLVNHDTAAYWERLLLLYGAGFLDRASPRALREGSRVLEIGAGYGALAWYIQEAVPGISYTVLDLPESLIYSAIYLNVLHHGATRFLANYEFGELLRNGESFDLVINTLSMSEMSTRQVQAYCEGITKLIAGGGAFFEQNQDNRAVGMINAQDIIAEYMQQEPPAQRLVQGYSHVWIVPKA